MEDLHFLGDATPQINAATIGISKKRWIAAEESEADEIAAQEVMRRHRFDVLPITVDSSSIRSYFTTKTWGNYDAVVRKDIDFADLLFFKTSIRNLFRQFADQDRPFFFLHKQHRVVGLVTAANLNCRAARVYLYSLQAEFEVEIGKLIQRHLSEDHILEIMPSDSRSLKRYRETKESGVDAQLVEYLTLSNLKKVLKQSGLYSDLGYNSKNQFKKRFGSLIKLRHGIAHPVRTLHGSDGSPSSIWKGVQTMEECLFHIKR